VYLTLPMRRFHLEFCNGSETLNTGMMLLSYHMCDDRCINIGTGHRQPDRNGCNSAALCMQCVLPRNNYTVNSVYL